MDKGTKIRTALRIAVSLNTAIYAVSAAVGALGFSWLTLAWAILTIISDLVVSALTTYYNNNYTEEACIGTGITRQLKAEKNNDYAGEYFYSEEIPREDDEVVEDIYEAEEGTEETENE
jgi:hypothetical protein